MRIKKLNLSQSGAEAPKQNGNGMSIDDVRLVEAKLNTEIIQRSEGDLLTQQMVSQCVSEMVKANEDDLQRYVELSSNTEFGFSELRELISGIQSRLSSTFVQVSDTISDNSNRTTQELKDIQDSLNKYLRVLSDATADSDKITWDNGEIQLGAWTFLSQARKWDLEIIKQVKNSTLYIDDKINKAFNEALSAFDNTETVITKVINQLGETEVVKKLTKSISDQNVNLSSISKELSDGFDERIKVIQDQTDGLGELIETNKREIKEDVDTQVTELIDETALIKAEFSENALLIAEKFSETKIEIDKLKTGSSIENMDSITAAIIPLKAGGSWKANSRSSRATSATLRQAIVRDDLALAKRIDSVSANLEKFPEVLAEVTNTIRAEVSETLEGVVHTVSESLLQVNSSMDGMKTTIQQQAKAIDGIYAEYTVKIDNNGLITGFGLINDGNTSAFGINADYFFVGSGDSSKKPFFVVTKTQVIDGISYDPGAYINNVLIGNESIGTSKIADAAITNAKISNIDATKITTGTLDAARITVGPNTKFADGYDPSDIKGTKWQTVSTAVNMNNMKDIGKYFCVGALTNSPVTPGAYLIVEPADATHVLQTIYKDGSVNSAYQRMLAGPTWTAWTKVTITDEFSSVTSIVNNTTVIEGGKIRTGTIEADKLNVRSLSALSATIGLLRTSTSGARTEISDNLIQVFDANGVVRLRIGVL